MTECYIGMGSNLAAPDRQLADAIAALGQLAHCRLLAISPVYRSSAVGPGSQPDYLNAAARMHTDLPASTLLARLHEIEARQGRERGVRWAARTLDLDLLLFGGQTIDDPPRLEVPHPRMLQRNFVVFPLLDLDPDLQLPDGRKLLPAAQALGWQGLVRLQKADLPEAASGSTGPVESRHGQHLTRDTH
jgi:2-amino-4-hydroxy-6-hydroxymethyldihydropteridine diphosphokinase